MANVTPRTLPGPPRSRIRNEPHRVARDPRETTTTTDDARSRVRLPPDHRDDERGAAGDGGAGDRSRTVGASRAVAASLRPGRTASHAVLASLARFGDEAQASPAHHRRGVRDACRWSRTLSLPVTRPPRRARHSVGPRSPCADLRSSTRRSLRSGVVLRRTRGDSKSAARVPSRPRHDWSIVRRPPARRASSRR